MLLLSGSLLLELFDFDPRPHLAVEGELFDKLSNELLLLANDVRYVGIVHVLVDLALHKGSALIGLDVALPSFFRHRDLFVEAKLFEVANSIVVCKRG